MRRWFTSPRSWTLAFSVVAVGLALGHAGPGSRYDANLAVLTATLVAILWYTCFTYEAVEDARALSYRAERASVSTLTILVQQVLDQLEELPKLGRNDDAADFRIRGTTVWREGDLDQLQRLATYLGPASAERAGHATTSLRWLGERIAEVRRVDPAYGYRWQRFPWQPWTDTMERAESDLKALLSLSER